MSRDSRSQESIELDAAPEIRVEVTRSPEFQAWRGSLKTFDLDGEHLYLLGGDVPAEHDQIVYQWARAKGLL